MNDATPDSTDPNDIATTDGDSDMRLRIGATVALGCAALVVLALAGGSLNITQTGLSMNVNPPS